MCTEKSSRPLLAEYQSARSPPQRAKVTRPSVSRVLTAARPNPVKRTTERRDDVTGRVAAVPHLTRGRAVGEPNGRALGRGTHRPDHLPARACRECDVGAGQLSADAPAEVGHHAPARHAPAAARVHGRAEHVPRPRAGRPLCAARPSNPAQPSRPRPALLAGPRPCSPQPAWSWIERLRLPLIAQTSARLS